MSAQEQKREQGNNQNWHQTKKKKWEKFVAHLV